MRIGTEDGPHGSARQSLHIVYDARSGVIVETHFFAGDAAQLQNDRRLKATRAAHASSGIAHEHLAVLTDPDIPQGEGELHVDRQSRRLVRRRVGLRIRR